MTKNRIDKAFDEIDKSFDKISQKNRKELELNQFMRNFLMRRMVFVL